MPFKKPALPSGALTLQRGRLLQLSCLQMFQAADTVRVNLTAESHMCTQEQLYYPCKLIVNATTCMLAWTMNQTLSGKAHI